MRIEPLSPDSAKDTRGMHRIRPTPIPTAIAFCLAGVLLWSGCSSVQKPIGPSVVVARVVSGQTVEILSSDRSYTVQVRLAGISAPDLKQLPWGLQAKQILEDWLLQQSVTLEISHKDIYNRQVAYIWHRNRLINEALLAEGYAMANPDVGADHVQTLAHAQHQARLLGLGIWNPAAPMVQTPVEFRQQSPASS